MKKALKIVLIIIVLALLALGLLILYATISDYKPQPITEVFESDKPDILPDTAEFNLFIWNIGYCGLSKDMDFFYDGGKMVRTTKEHVLDNIKNVKSCLVQNDSVDFFLIQEVDIHSKRSYKTNQFDTLNFKLKNYLGMFGKNYDVWHVPLPFSNPLGIVESGIATFTRYTPKTSKRYSFPGNYAWPKGLFMLDRCFLVNRYELSNGKEFLVINTHNSAYDDGSLKKGQMEYLKEFLLNEYKKGNYIIVGGDWNQSPFELDEHYIHKFDSINHSRVGKDYPEKGWHWIFNNNVPTNRRLQEPYSDLTTLRTVIDFYLVSPNIEKVKSKTIDLGFRNSDHQPVVTKIKLIKQ
ncbi:MAG: endonuclease/exonuclease/phosphatase family protein [Chlorobi bacterium]|nr:endonuclease/exonuclease/phosphatase family protein [Chlorobiota bacterium]